MVRKRTIAGLAGFAGLMALIPWSAQADQVFLDDVIVDGSLCVGVDCSNGESFGFDTIRLKENNLRIDFTDTSTTASFPQTDWELQANESSNGGKNWFAFFDSTAGRRIFTMEGGAPTNAMYIDSGGDVGLGTNTPVVELEIVDGDSPTVRLRQDGSSGFSQQTWDLVGNETNFFIRDATNGSQLPFRIEPGADTNSLFVEGDNDVGVGTNNPAAALHIDGNNGSNAAQLLLTNAGSGATGLPRIQLTNTDAPDTEEDWQVDVNDNGLFRISADGTGNQELAIGVEGNGSCLQVTDTATGNDFTISVVNGVLTTAAGTC